MHWNIALVYLKCITNNTCLGGPGSCQQTDQGEIFFGINIQTGIEHFAWLSWHKMDDNDGLKMSAFDFSCELYSYLCNILKCSCVCIKFLLEYIKKTKPEMFQHLPNHIQHKIWHKKNFMACLYFPEFYLQNGMKIIDRQREQNQNTDSPFLHPLSFILHQHNR